MANGHGGARKGAGRKKDECEVREAAKQYTVEAIERLAFWMRSDNYKASVGSAVALLNRAHGMPTQQVDVNDITDRAQELGRARERARSIASESRALH